MADLIPITDPATGRVYRVHPFIAEQGEWFAAGKAGLRAQLPGMAAFERELARLATPAAASAASRTPHKPTRKAPAMLERLASGR